MELSAEKKRTAFPRIFSTRFFAVFYFFIALVPVLSSGDNHLTSRSSLIPIAIPNPSLILLLSLFVPIFLGDLVGNKGRWLMEIYRRTARISVPVGFLALVVLLYSLHPEAYWGQGIVFAIADVYNWVLLMLGIGIATSWTLRTHYRKIFIGVLLVMTLGMVWNIMSPETFDTGKTNRAVGFGGSPNKMAVSFLLVGIAAIDWSRNLWMNLVLLVLTGLNIYITLSVGGLIMFMAVFGAYVLLVLMKGQSLSRKIIFVFSVGLMVIASGPLLQKLVDSSDLFSTYSVRNRVQDIASMLQGDFSFATEHSRKRLAEEYFDEILQAPFVGHGTGYSENFSTGAHNMFLRHWFEHGLIGLFAYTMVLIGGTLHFYRLRDTRGMVFMLIAFMESFHNQILLSYKPFIVLLGILGVLAYLENGRDRRRERTLGN